MSTTDEDTNMKSETTKDVLDDESNPTGKDRENEMDIDVDEDQIDDDDVISKDELRQSTKTLDDPSQFYFDDDIPTPGLSEDNSDDKENDSEEETSKKIKNEDDIKEEEINTIQEERQGDSEYKMALHREISNRADLKDERDGEETTKSLKKNTFDDSEDGRSEIDRSRNDDGSEEEYYDDSYDYPDDYDNGYNDDCQESSVGEWTRDPDALEDTVPLSKELMEEYKKDCESYWKGKVQKQVGENEVKDEEGSILIERDSEEESDGIERDGEALTESDDNDTKEEGEEYKGDKVKSNQKETDEEMDDSDEEDESNENAKVDQSQKGNVDSNCEIESKKYQDGESQKSSQNKNTEGNTTIKNDSNSKMRMNLSIPPIECGSKSLDLEQIPTSNKDCGRNKRVHKKLAKSKDTLEIKYDPDICAGLKVCPIDLEKIRLKKKFLLARVNNIERFLDPNISAKEWRNEVGKDEAEFGSQLERKIRQVRQLQNEMKVATKRKRSIEDSQGEVVVKKDGRGRPKGWRKVKVEPIESAPQNSAMNSTKSKVEDKPLVKRSKKDQMLLLKALDEEMFKMDEESNKEMERISQGLEYQCSVCSQVFIEKKNLSKHFFKCLMKFTQSGRSSFKCAICFEYFSLLESLESHIEKKHSDVCDDPFQCAQCSLCFDQGCSLKEHILEKHEVFQCSNCEKYYRTQHMLDVHVSKKHGDMRRVKTEISTEEKSEKFQVQGKVVNMEVDGVRGRLKRETRRNSLTDKVTSQTTVSQQEPAKLDGECLEVRLKSPTPASVTSKTEVEPTTLSESVPVRRRGRKRSILNVPLDSPKIVNTSKTNSPIKCGFKGSPAKPAIETVPTTSKAETKLPQAAVCEVIASEENKLGRGRRVKKKKALDYEDISVPMRATSKSTEAITAASLNSTVRGGDIYGDIKLAANKGTVLSKSTICGEVKVESKKATVPSPSTVVRNVKPEPKKAVVLSPSTVYGKVRSEPKKATVLSSSTVYGEVKPEPKKETVLFPSTVYRYLKSEPKKTTVLSSSTVYGDVKSEPKTTTVLSSSTAYGDVKSEPKTTTVLSPSTVYGDVKSEPKTTTVLSSSTVHGDVKCEPKTTTVLSPSTVYRDVKCEPKTTTVLSPSTVYGDVKCEPKTTTVLSPSTIYGDVKSEPKKATALSPSTIPEEVKPESKNATVVSTSTISAEVNAEPQKTPVLSTCTDERPSGSEPNKTNSTDCLPTEKSDQDQPPDVSVPLEPLVELPKALDTSSPTEVSQETASPLPSISPPPQPTGCTDESNAPASVATVKRKVHVCPKCRKAFAHKYLVKVHMKWKHNIFKRKTLMDSSGHVGGDGKESAGKKKRHRTPISARGALFDCTLCGESFTKFSILDDHYLGQHDGIPCGICRILIKSRFLLDKHLAACHEEEDRFVCPVCDKQMASKATLRKHLAMHEDRRPYECVVCKRSFRYSYDMRLHMRRTHKRDIEGRSALPSTVTTESNG